MARDSSSSHCPGSPFNRKAELPLEFLIVGGGLAGLACAYNLQQAGHHVRVLEQSGGVGNGAGGMRVPPNMANLLIRWGLGPKLASVAVKCPRVTFRIGHTGETLGSLIFYEEVMKVFEADLLFIHHADLHVMLYELALAAGVRVDFNVVVKSIDPSHPFVELHTGERLTADMIVGADGERGLVRRLLVDENSEREEIGRHPVFCFTIPMSLVRSDPKFADLNASHEMNVWFGDSCGIITYPVRGGDLLSVQLYWHKNEDVEQGWVKQLPLSDLDVSGFEERIQRLIKLGTTATQSQHIVRGPLEEWFHRSGHVVLIGDAAHVLPPCGTCNSAICLEDAAVLGSLFSRLRTRDQIPHLLSGYQTLREDRCEVVTVAEDGNAEVLSCPPGPLQQMRNEGVRATVYARSTKDDEGPPDGVLKAQWEEFSALFGFNAYDSADSWWVEWGVLRDHAAEVCPAERLNLRVQVTLDF